MDKEALKRKAAEAALQHVRPGQILGIGTGSTVNHFIDLLAEHKIDVPGAVSSSEASTEKLKAIGIPVLDLNEIGTIDLYVDGADEANPTLHLIKGGGGAHTREKIVAQCARRFVCIVDASKKVEVLGQFPLPVEVIPMARSHVARQLVKLGGDPVYREGVITDNGNVILDVHNLKIDEPRKLEAAINQIVGVVANGLFAERAANVLLLSTHDGVKMLTAK